MGKIYLTSDLHIGHDREFIWKIRGFNSIQEMNDAYVERWNSIITDEDDVYILGGIIESISKKFSQHAMSFIKPELLSAS